MLTRTNTLCTTRLVAISNLKDILAGSAWSFRLLLAFNLPRLIIYQLFEQFNFVDIIIDLNFFE